MHVHNAVCPYRDVKYRSNGDIIVRSMVFAFVKVKKLSVSS